MNTDPHVLYYDLIGSLKEMRPPPFLVCAWEKKKKNASDEGSTSRCNDTTSKTKMKAHAFHVNLDEHTLSEFNT